jgi:GT2 family glycosyltransferase
MTVQNYRDCHATLARVQPHIYVVLPVYNRRELLERFLTCMREQTCQNFTVIVVDDGSTDGTADLLKAFPEVETLSGDGNLWWTGGINCGIRHALSRAHDDDAVLVINDDVEIEPKYLEFLFRLWQRNPRTIIGSVVVDINNPERIVDGGRIVNWWTAKMRILNANRDLRDFDPCYSVDVSLLTGWGTLFPVTAFKEVGLYDERHFKQCGDTELPVRAKNRGFRLILSYGAIVKVHLDRTAGINTLSRYSFRDAKEYFFGVKSNARLKYRIHFSYATATNTIAFVSFFICDLTRVTVHFLKRLRLRSYLAMPAL